MKDEFKEFIGVDSLYRAKVTKDDEDEYIVESPEYLAPAAEISGGAALNKQLTYYDNKPGNHIIIEGPTELKIVVSNLSQIASAELEGKFYNPATGRVYDDGDNKAPDYAIGFRYHMGGDNYRYFWYLKGKLMLGPEDAKTRGENAELKNREITYTAVPTSHQYLVDGKYRGVKRVYGDTPDDAFDATGWFAQVQAPNTEGSPAAIALSTSVPNDDAVDVAVNAAIVLTFNNKIKSEYIQLINTVTGVPVVVAKSWDTTGKILTMTPNANMDNNAKHNVVLAGVKDVYGQELASIVIDFTTIEA